MTLLIRVVGQINGPDNVLEGDAPYALVTVSAPFTAKGEDGTVSNDDKAGQADQPNKSNLKTQRLKTCH